MHRSGTSAVAGVLARLGAQAPRSLMAPARDNPTGFLESIELQKFHDQILHSAGSRWSDWTQFNPDWSNSLAAEQFSDLLPGLIQSEFGDAPILLVKDPRICRFLPFWLQVLRRLRIEPKIVLPVRNPVEVAGSLEKRNDFSPAHSLLIWLRHVLEAEHATRAQARSLIRYGLLLRDWRSQARKIGADLSVTWPRWSSAVEVEIDEYLSAELRHHVADDGAIAADPAIDAWAGKAYRALQDLVDGGKAGNAALRALDEVRDDFNRAGGMFALAMRQQEIRLDSARSQLASLKLELEEQAKQAQGVHAELKRQADGLQATHAQATNELQAKLKGLDQSVQKLTSENLAKAAKLGEASVKVQAVEQARVKDKELIAAHEATIKQLTAQARELSRASGELLEKLRAAEQGRVKDKERIVAHEATTKQQTAQVTALTGKLDKLSAQGRLKEQAAADTSAKLKAAQAAQAKDRETLAAQKAIVQQLSSKVADLERNNQKLRLENEEKARSIADRFRELATLTKMLDELDRGSTPQDGVSPLRGAPSLGAIRKALRGKAS